MGMVMCRVCIGQFDNDTRNAYWNVYEMCMKCVWNVWNVYEMCMKCVSKCVLAIWQWHPKYSRIRVQALAHPSTVV